MKYQVSVTRCGNYEPENVLRAAQENLAPFGGMKSFVRNGDQVVVKVNLLVSRSPERAVTTHPAVVEAVVCLIQDAGGIAVLGDSPGGRNTRHSYKGLLKRTGMQEVCDRTGCSAVLFDTLTATVAFPEGRVFKRFDLPKVVMDADAIVAVPKLKTHQLTLMTGAVKLLYGYIPGLTKAEYHLYSGKDVSLFADLLVDIYQACPPSVFLMDAIDAMEGNGPSHGNPRRLGLLLGGPSGTAMDYLAASTIGYEPLIIPTIKAAADRGIGPSNEKDIEIFGIRPAEVRVNDFRKPGTSWFLRMPSCLLDIAEVFLASYPEIDSEKCCSCGLCAENCPPNAISRGIQPYAIDYRSCIRCYCCNELCPEGAIKIRRSGIRRLTG